MNIRNIMALLIAGLLISVHSLAAENAVVEAGGLDEFNGQIIELGYVDPNQKGNFSVMGIGFIEDGAARIEAPADMPTNAQLRILTGKRKPLVGNCVISPDAVTQATLEQGVLQFSGGRHQSLIYPGGWEAETEAETLQRLRTAYITSSDPTDVMLALQAAWFDGEDDMQVEILERLRGEFGDALPIRIMDAHTAARKAELARAMKDFVALTLDGEEVRLADVLQKNKYTLVEFWASWCGPCIAEIPNLQANYDKYREAGFEILSVNLDEDRDAWETASVEKYDIDWINASDGQTGFNGPIASLYRVKAIPASYLVTPEGKRIATHLRGDLLGEKLEELLSDQDM